MQNGVGISMQIIIFVKMFVKTAKYSVVWSSGTLGGQRIHAFVGISIWPSQNVLPKFTLTTANGRTRVSPY